MGERLTKQLVSTMLFACLIVDCLIDPGGPNRDDQRTNWCFPLAALLQDGWERQGGWEKREQKNCVPFPQIFPFANGVHSSPWFRGAGGQLAVLNGATEWSVNHWFE